MQYVLASITAVMACATGLIATSGARTASAEPAEYWLGVRAAACQIPPAPHEGVVATFAIPPLLREGETFRNRFELPGVPDQMWLDISLFDNGFAPGTFLGRAITPPLVEPSLVTWSGILAGKVHYYRINARVNGQWYALTTDRFQTPDCQDVFAMECDSDRPGEVWTSFNVWLYGEAIESWIDISLRQDGFVRNEFIGAGPFPARYPDLVIVDPPIQSEFVWRGISVGLRHYFRSNVLLQGGAWSEEHRGSFLALGCNTLLRTT